MALMKSNREIHGAARKLFRSCLENGFMNEERVRRAVSAIVAAKSRHSMNLLKELERLVRMEIQKCTLQVESSVPLLENHLRDIQSKIQSQYAAPLTMNYQVNPALIGGLRIKIGSNVWDGSVTARLERLKVLTN